MSGNSKKAFDTAHTSVPVYYPDELAIVGGATHIADKRRRGPLDTEAPKEPNALYRPLRLAQPFKDGFVESIDAHGVLTDITITMRDDVPTVETGQCRTMGARQVNFERKIRCGIDPSTPDRKAAERCALAQMPLRSMRCSGKKTIDDILARQRIMIENNLRHDDLLETTLEQLRAQLDETNNNYELAGACVGGLSAERVKVLMTYDEYATPEMREAVNAGRIGISAAATLLAEKDPDAQRKLLADLMSAPDQTVRRAAVIVRKHRAEARGETSTANPFQGRRELTRFRDYVAEHSERGAFWEGVRAVLDLQTKGATEDERLTQVYKAHEKAKAKDEAEKPTKPAKAAKPPKKPKSAK